MIRSRRAVVLALFLGVAACGGDETAGTPDTTATTRTLLGGPVEGGPATLVRRRPDTGQVVAINVEELGYNRGASEAPLKVIEFSDFGCGYCRRFHQETFPTLYQEFIESGKVEWKFMPFITGNFQNSLAVTEASECALEQSRAIYEAVGGRLWELQTEWKATDEPEALVRGWAADAGADLARFDSCLAENRRMERIDAANMLADQLGVRATPTIWLVGFGPIQGALPLATFQGVLGTIHDDIVAGVTDPVGPPPAN